MMILLEDFDILNNVLIPNKGGRIIIYNKQDLEQLLDTFRVTPYLDILSDKILFLGRNELQTVIHRGILL
jgi:hypothetical protein